MNILPKIQRYHIFFIAAIFVVIAALIYSNTLHSPFHFDDEQDIVNNPAIHSPWNKAIWRSPRPISYFTFAINYAIHGLDVEGYHVVNILIHVTNAILIYFMLLLIFRTQQLATHPLFRLRYEIAFLSTLLFLVHPVQTQAVTYIVQRMAALATLFYLVAIILYLKGRLAKNTLQRWTWFICALITAILACLSKQTAYTLPLMILLFELAFFRKSGQQIKANFKTIGILVCGIILLAFLFFSTQNFNWNLLLRTIPPQQGHTYAISGTEYILTQFHVVLTYIRLLFLPVNQNLDYDYPIASTLYNGSTLFSGLALLSLLMLGLWLLRKHRLIGFGILWFFIALSIESSIYPLPNVIFEHRMYLPSIGASIAVIVGLVSTIPSNKPQFLRIAIALIVLILMGLTYERNKVWSSEYALWTDVISKSPHKARAWSNRGKANFNQNEYENALADFTKAIELNPQYIPPLYNRGLAYIALDQYDLAITDLSQLIVYRPNHTRAYCSRSIARMKSAKIEQAFVDINQAIEKDSTYVAAYFQRGQLNVHKQLFQNAHQDYQHALTLDHQNVEALTNLGILYSQQGDYKKALSNFNHAIQLAPTNPDIFDNRGFSYLKQKQYDLAISDFQQALQIDSRHTEARYHRGLLFAAIDSSNLALADFNNVLENAPKHVDAYFQRALLYTKIGAYQKAIDDFQIVLEVRPHHAASYINRGLNYANMNEWQNAINDYNRAIELDNSQQTAYLNRAVAHYYSGDFQRAWVDIKHLQDQGHHVYPQLVSRVRKAMH